MTNAQRILLKAANDIIALAVNQYHLRELGESDASPVFVGDIGRDLSNIVDAALRDACSEAWMLGEDFTPRFDDEDFLSSCNAEFKRRSETDADQQEAQYEADMAAYRRAAE